MYIHVCQHSVNDMYLPTHSMNGHVTGVSQYVGVKYVANRKFLRAGSN